MQAGPRKGARCDSRRIFSFPSAHGQDPGDKRRYAGGETGDGGEVGNMLRLSYAFRHWRPYLGVALPLALVLGAALAGGAFEHVWEPMP